MIGFDSIYITPEAEAEIEAELAREEAEENGEVTVPSDDKVLQKESGKFPWLLAAVAVGTYFYLNR